MTRLTVWFGGRDLGLGGVEHSERELTRVEVDDGLDDLGDGELGDRWRAGTGWI